MGIFRRKFRVKARDSRGQKTEDGLMSQPDAVKDILVTNYEQTKEDFDNLPEDKQATFKEALGDTIADAFCTSNTMVDMQLITMEESEMEDIFERMNAWQEANDA